MPSPAGAPKSAGPSNSGSSVTASPLSRYPTAHQSSSAFSSSANPNEDWTKISDLAERRRIQNRIAQRNYRKKLKRRMEDLERRASDTSVSPEPVPAELAVSVSNRGNGPPPSKVTPAMSGISSHSQESSVSTESIILDDPPLSAVDARTPSPYMLSTPSMPMYSALPLSDYLGHDVDVNACPPAPYPLWEADFGLEYGASLPPTIPVSMVSENVKQQPAYRESDLVGPFAMNYASLTGIDPSTISGYQPFPIRTPSLSDSNPFYESRENSPLTYQQPVTPRSRSTSPPVWLF